MNTIHQMKLQSKYFDYIKYGTKIYEIRLNDKKRRNIHINDKIEFIKEPKHIEKIICNVEELIYYKDFNELINSIDIKYLSSEKESKDDLLKSLNEFYTLDNQNKYGVVAIKINKDVFNEK